MGVFKILGIFWEIIWNFYYFFRNFFWIVWNFFGITLEFFEFFFLEIFWEFFWTFFWRIVLRGFFLGEILCLHRDWLVCQDFGIMQEGRKEGRKEEFISLEVRGKLIALEKTFNHIIFQNVQSINLVYISKNVWRREEFSTKSYRKKILMRRRF